MITKETKLRKDLEKLMQKIYKTVEPSKREVQKKLTPYTPKPYGTKKTYPQDWPIYTKACSDEKLMFLRLLKDATDHIGLEYEYKGNGRPPVYYAEVVKCLCIKAYHNLSSWRLESELHIARSMGIIQFVPKKATINKYMKDPLITPLLHKLYQILAEPLAEIEIYAATDATGFSKKYGDPRWMNVRHKKGEKTKAKDYVRLHAITGVKTNVIITAKITQSVGKGTHESYLFKSLLDDTAKIFKFKEISADRGYLGRKNVLAIYQRGSAPFIMGKKNVNVERFSRITPWLAMLRLWKDHQIFFAERYHRRSNVESTFGALKRKFDGFCRTKENISQENEILCKIVCFNACVLAEAMLSYHLKYGFIAT